MDEYVERKLEEKRKEKEEAEGAAAPDKKKDKKPDKKKDKGAVAVEIKGDPEELGKAVGKDENKETFVSLLGEERARMQANMLAEQAVIHLEHFDDKAELLRLLPHFVINRRS